MDTQSGTFWQAIATAIIWVLLLAMTTLAFIFLGDTLGEDIIGLMFILVVGGVASTGFVWKWGRLGNQDAQHTDKDAYAWDAQADKRKRRNGDELSRALRDLSNDELVRLRDRLARGEIDDDDLLRLLGEDASSSSSTYN